jgi:hypothetical protein
VPIEHLFVQRLLGGVSLNFSNTHSKTIQIGRASLLATPLRTSIESRFTPNSLGLSPYHVWKLSNYLFVGGLIGFDHRRSRLALGVKADPASPQNTKPKG